MSVNRNFGRLNNGALEYAPNPVIHNGLRTYTNDTNILLSLGYKPIVRTQQPEPVDGFYFTSTWAENEITIEQVFTQVEQPVVEDLGEVIDVMEGTTP